MVLFTLSDAKPEKEKKIANVNTIAHCKWALTPQSSSRLKHYIVAFGSSLVTENFITVGSRSLPEFDRQS